MTMNKNHSGRSYTLGGVVLAGEAPAPIPTLHTPSAGRDLTLDLPGEPPRVGEIVLFCIGPNLFRPLLVVAADPLTAKICGTLFTNADYDRGAPWVKKYAFAPPTKQQPYLYIENALWGDAEGQWRRKANLPIPLVGNIGRNDYIPKLASGDPRTSDAGGE